MIKPTVGRIVWFRPDAVFIPTLPGQPDGPLAAIVVGVQSDERVNLTVFGADGSMHPRTGVYLEQNEPDPAPGACCWMPFQKGQATKTDAVLDELKKLGNEAKDKLVAGAKAVEGEAEKLLHPQTANAAGPVQADPNAPAAPQAAPPLQPGAAPEQAQPAADTAGQPAQS